MPDRKKPTDELNLAEDIGPDEISRISDDLLRGIEDDDRSRKGSGLTIAPRASAYLA